MAYFQLRIQLLEAKFNSLVFLIYGHSALFIPNIFVLYTYNIDISVYFHLFFLNTNNQIIQLSVNFSVRYFT